MSFLILCSLLARISLTREHKVSDTLSHPEPPFDCDGSHVVGINRSGNLVVWDGMTGRAVRTLGAFQDPFCIATLLPGGKTALIQTLDPHSDWGNWGTSETGHHDRSIRLWDIDSGKVIWRIPDGLFKTLSRDGQRIYGVSARAPKLERPRLVCWGVKAGSPLFTIPKFVADGDFSSFAEESSNGKRLLYSNDHGVTVFDLNSREMLFSIDNPIDAGAFAAAFTRTGDTFFYDSPPGEHGSIGLYSLSQKSILRYVKFPTETLSLAGEKNLVQVVSPL